jgi:LAO/AO transport system kinase
LAADVLNGNRRALARAITAVENDAVVAAEILGRLYPRSGNARVIGITGPPGAGKSTLVDGLAKACRARGQSVGIIAVDPTSPFSGGAILGDRIRMADLSLDAGVFVRSMATRGSLGGLSRRTSDVVKIMDAAGMAMIFVETVGVGQSEMDVVQTADTTVVVLMPGMGDGVQAMKAGILEAGDVFAVNKADHAGTDLLLADLDAMLALAPPGARRAPICSTVAAEGRGVVELLSAIDAHGDWLRQGDELARRRAKGARYEVFALIEDRIRRDVLGDRHAAGWFDGLIAAVARRDIDPYAAVAELLAEHDAGRKRGWRSVAGG